MCGILGYAGPPAAAPLLAPGAARLLSHRGPDGAGEHAWRGEAASWQLAHTRLAIVDLSDAGAQPMTVGDGSLTMVFNGEIYNAPELRRYCEAKGRTFRSAMDGEVILHLWEMEGPACLARLNGIFALAVASTVTGDVVLARDPLGVKPLFYVLPPDGSLWFGSEPAALEAVGAPVGEHDVAALAQFLTFLWVAGPRSPRAAVRALEPGHTLRWTPAGAAHARFVPPLVPAPAGEPSPPNVVEEAGERLRAAAARQLLADVPIGLMASGGVDSGLLWWAGRGGLDRAYTIQWAAGDDREGLADDAHAVAGLERRFGTPVTYLAGEEAHDVLPPSGDLLADPAYDLTRLIARRAREHGHKVLWSGQGGDELFGGYRRHAVAPILGSAGGREVGRRLEPLLRRLPARRLASEYAARLARAASERDPFRAYMHLCSYSTGVERAEALGCTEREVADDVVWQRHQAVYDALPAGLPFLRKAMAIDLAVYLPGLGLAYADRAGMEFGVEIRVPWLDLELVRWSLQLPDGALVRWGRGKWAPRELAAGVLGKEIAHRPKRAFAAPAARVGQEAGHGDRGFRQGAYFARARRILDAYLSRETRVA